MKKSLSALLGVVAICGLCANVYAADAPTMTGMDAAKADAKAADTKAAETKAVDAKPAETKPAEPVKAAAPAPVADPLAGVFIAGTAPHQRPANAPVIEAMKKDKAWYDNAVTGVSRPFPWSMKFLENQENWFTPFSHPGMTGRYDIRGWHKG
jgi:hypothetical protein